MSLFDAYIFVDWSARNGIGPARPVADSIWIGESVRGAEPRESYVRTRNQACAALIQRASSLTAERSRILIGFDFPYSYPQGFGKCLSPGARKLPWLRVWEKLSSLVVDDDDNKSNRFGVAARINREIGGRRKGPFWGRPASCAVAGLHPYAAKYPFTALSGVKLNRLRITEKRLRGVQESWKLIGVGSVGSQALLGIPRVHFLRCSDGLAGHSLVWPFETGFTSSVTPAHGPFILHAEIWPGIVKQEVMAMLRARPKIIRDQAQVRCMCDWAANLDQEGRLGRFFDSPADLTDLEVEQCITEEGWILGSV
jgi:hypothetical protein